MMAFATEWLAGLYGADVRKAIGKTHATRWNDEPWALGAFSAAAAGGQPSRRILMEPLRERICSSPARPCTRRCGARSAAPGNPASARPRRRCAWSSASAPKPQAERRRPRRNAAASRSDDAQKPKALIAWSSGKDSAWALHEVRRAGDYDIVGALTTVTETFARVSMHGVREELLRAQLEAAGLPSIIVRDSVSVPERDLRSATWRRRLAQAKADGVTHVIFGDLFLEDRARLSRAEARRHRHDARCFRSGGGRPMRWRAR